MIRELQMCNMQNCKITKYNLSWLYYYKSVILHITLIPQYFFL